MSKFFHFTLSNEHYKLLATPNGSDDQPVYQIRFFCSKLNNASSVKDMLIEFPSACEIRMNGNVIGGAVRKRRGGDYVYYCASSDMHLYRVYEG